MSEQIVPVTVTRNMIHWAIQQTSTQCAIALALRDASDDFVFPHVDQNVIRVSDRRTGLRYEFKTPDVVAKWIDRFDRDVTKVRPFTFELHLEDADKIKPVQRTPLPKLLKIAENYRNQKVHRNAPQGGRTTQKKLSAGTTKNTSKRELRDVDA